MMCFIISRKLSKLIGKAPKQRLDYFDLYSINLHGIPVNLYVSLKRATKSTHIHCTEGGDIIWEQLYPFGGMSRPSSERKVVLKPSHDKSAITAVIIRGKPSIITGLESGDFKSHLSLPEADTIHLMAESNLWSFLDVFKMRAECSSHLQR